ncbi:DUF3718 domain-containing protein [Aliikangiella coralliicola]|uniref:DUF3718 domain-containing protein n=1 Tax=Aliikangiella coralliicola TaxID=2592383 RepID=A0A545UAA9_9GAMM|nr:DUF3718 domain-containing protein [Aliikangiella coralliicola]TQV86411.1 DUF3718 domain-containing protein [Aliikangiella coralliicola]
MKNQFKVFSFVLLLSALAAFSGSARTAESNNYRFNKLTQSLCDSVKNDQLAKFRSELLTARVHIRNIYSQVQCDGSPLLDIAMINQSKKMVSYLKNKVLHIDVSNLQQEKVAG